MTSEYKLLEQCDRCQFGPVMGRGYYQRTDPDIKPEYKYLCDLCAGTLDAGNYPGFNEVQQSILYAANAILAKLNNVEKRIGTLDKSKK